MNTAFLIIDVQNDYFPGGKMELYDSLNAGRRIEQLLDYFRTSSRPVIHVQHISTRPGASFFLPGTDGASFHDSVRPGEGEKIIIKNLPGSFHNTGLDSYLKGLGITRLVIAGMMTHMCVDSTVRTASELGYDCILAGDCCATRSLWINGREIPAVDVQDSFLASLNGTFSKVLDKDSVIRLLEKEGPGRMQYE